MIPSTYKHYILNVTEIVFLPPQKGKTKTCIGEYTGYAPSAGFLFKITERMTTSEGDFLGFTYGYSEEYNKLIFNYYLKLNLEIDTSQLFIFRQTSDIVGVANLLTRLKYTIRELYY